MPIEPIPITTPIDKDVDEVGLSTYGAAKLNGYVNGAGFNRWYGLSLFCDLGTASGVDGLFWWPNQSKVIAVSGGRTFLVNSSLGTFSEITGSTFQSNKRVTFADFGSAVYAANGGKIVKIPSSGSTAYLTDPQAPVAVSHVSAVDQYLVANEVGTSKAHHSEALNPESWLGQYMTPEGMPDTLLAVGAANKRLLLIGSQTAEMWRTDGEGSFVSEYQGYVQRGISAPNSLVWGWDGTWYWLDNYRQIVRLAGLQTEPLSLSLNKYLQGFSTVSDAIGDYLVIEGRPYYVLHFPTEGKTLCLDIIPKEGIQWYELGAWTAGDYARWAGNAYCLAEGWNFPLVGDYRTGKIYKVSSAYLDFNGETERTMVRTGHVNRGTMGRRKRSHAIVIRLKRTENPSAPADASLMVKWRDNGNSTWSNERTIPLTNTSGTDFRVKLTRLGSYYSRQYEFAMASAYPLVLVSAEEEFDYAPY